MMTQSTKSLRRARKDIGPLVLTPTQMMISRTESLRRKARKDTGKYLHPQAPLAAPQRTPPVMTTRKPRREK